MTARSRNKTEGVISRSAALSLRSVDPFFVDCMAAGYSLRRLFVQDSAAAPGRYGCATCPSFPGCSEPGSATRRYPEFTLIKYPTSVWVTPGTDAEMRPLAA